MTSEQPAEMSQNELDEYLDELVAVGKEDTSEFEAAYTEWEKRESAS